MNSCLFLSVTAAQAHLLSFPRYAHALMSLLAGDLSFQLGFPGVKPRKGAGCALHSVRRSPLGRKDHFQRQNFGTQTNGSAVYLPFRYLKCRGQKWLSGGQ